MNTMTCIIFGLLGFMAIANVALLVYAANLKADIFDLNFRVKGMYNDVKSIKNRIQDMQSRLDGVYADVSTIWDEVCATKPCSDLCGESVDVECAKDEKEELEVHLIKPEEYYFENEYDPYALVYHVKSGQLRYYTTPYLFIDIENISELVGEGLMFFGINSKEPNVVYVRNHNMKADFRIERIGFEGTSDE